MAHPERENCPWIPIEGCKQIEELSGQRPIELLLFSEASESQIQSLLPLSRQSQRLSPSLLRSLSSVEASQQVLAFFEKPSWDWRDVTPWVLYLLRLQDPGNLGTLLRTARATGIFSVATSPKSVSCFNSKVVRASAASLFAVPFLEGIEAHQLKERGYHLWAAMPQGGQSLFEARFRSPMAVLIGNEGAGLEASVVTAAEDHLHIPMQASCESLNAAVAGSLILYEVFRQRGSHG